MKKRQSRKVTGPTAVPIDSGSKRSVNPANVEPDLLRDWVRKALLQLAGDERSAMLQDTPHR